MRQPIKKTLLDIPVDFRETDSHQVIFSSMDSHIPANLMLVTKSRLDAGGTFDWHKHQDFDEFFIVVEGEGKIDFETGESFFYREGDTINCPAGVAHKIENTLDKASVFYFFRIRNNGE